MIYSEEKTKAVKSFVAIDSERTRLELAFSMLETTAKQCGLTLEETINIISDGWIFHDMMDKLND